MPSSSPNPPLNSPVIDRARPLLGTRVAMRVGGLPEAEAHRAIDRAFGVVEAIHGLMSFHESASDVSALNRKAAREPVTVSSRTYDVMRCALEMAAASSGVFDITVAAQLVDWGFLPKPPDCLAPDPQATWRDIELLGDCRIRFHRPLWIDLGGIAKGYAVDCAVEEIRAGTEGQICVNAGGDLRVSGPTTERVLLRTAVPGDTVPVVEIENGSIASSSGREDAKRQDGRRVGPHVHGVRRGSVGTCSFVSVIAERCMIADALTKVVLARGIKAVPLLRAHGAVAYHLSARAGWRTMGSDNQ